MEVDGMEVSPLREIKRSSTMASPAGSEALRRMFGDFLFDAESKHISPVEALADTHFAILFAAEANADCRAHLPELVSLYERLQRNDQPWQVVFW